MKKFKYLFANGCSFTAGDCMSEQMYLQTYNKKYLTGEFCNQEQHFRFTNILSDKLNLEEINIASDGISNDRIFRTTFDWIENNKQKVKDTLFVLGLTNNLRKDLWSNYKNEHIVTSEIYQDIKYIARDCNTTEDEVNQWRNFELKYLINEDEIEKDLIRKCLLLNSYVEGNMIFLNAWRRSDVVHSDLKFLKIKTKNYEGYNWSSYIKSYNNTYNLNHPSKIDHIKIADLLYQYIKELP